jgi:hypothetical protein
MKILISILFLLITLGCSKQEDPEVLVVLDASGQILLENSPITIESLRNTIADKWHGSGNFPVYIYAENETPFSNVSEVMMLCADIGLWMVTLVNESGVRYPPEYDTLSPDPVALAKRDVEFPDIGKVTVRWSENAKFGDMFEVLHAYETLGVLNPRIEKVSNTDDTERISSNSIRAATLRLPELSVRNTRPADVLVLLQEILSSRLQPEEPAFLIHPSLLPDLTEPIKVYSSVVAPDPFSLPPENVDSGIPTPLTVELYLTNATLMEILKEMESQGAFEVKTDGEKIVLIEYKQGVADFRELKEIFGKQPPPLSVSDEF